MTQHTLGETLTPAHIAYIERMQTSIPAHATNLVLDRLQRSVITDGRFKPAVTPDDISVSAHSYVLGAEYDPIRFIFIRAHRQMSTLDLARAMMQLGRPPNPYEAERIEQHFSWGLRPASLAKLHAESDPEALKIDIFVRRKLMQGHPFQKTEPLYLFRLKEGPRTYYSLTPIPYERRVFPVVLT